MNEIAVLKKLVVFFYFFVKMRRRDEILRQECRRKTKENAFLLGEIDLLKKELHEARSSSTGAGRSQKRDVSNQEKS